MEGKEEWKRKKKGLGRERAPSFFFVRSCSACVVGLDTYTPPTRSPTRSSLRSRSSIASPQMRMRMRGTALCALSLARFRCVRPLTARQPISFASLPRIRSRLDCGVCFRLHATYIDTCIQYYIQYIHTAQHTVHIPVPRFRSLSAACGSRSGTGGGERGMGDGGWGPMARKRLRGTTFCCRVNCC